MPDTRLATNIGLYCSTTLLGCSVKNPAGETLGYLRDLVIDLGEGRIAAALLWLHPEGGEERLVPVPLSTIGYDPERKHCILHVAGDKLERAPVFRQEDWPGMIDRAW